MVQAACRLTWDRQHICTKATGLRCPVNHPMAILATELHPEDLVVTLHLAPTQATLAIVLLVHHLLASISQDPTGRTRPHLGQARTAKVDLLDRPGIHPWAQVIHAWVAHQVPHTCRLDRAKDHILAHQFLVTMDHNIMGQA